MPEQKNLKKEHRSRENLNNYAKYSGMAFEMIVIILAGVFAGIKLDKWLHMTNPVFTAICAALGVILAIYIVIKDLLRRS